MSEGTNPKCGWCSEEEGIVCTSASVKTCCYDCAKLCKDCKLCPMGPDDEACEACRFQSGEAQR